MNLGLSFVGPTRAPHCEPSPGWEAVIVVFCWDAAALKGQERVCQDLEECQGSISVCCCI